MRETPKDVKISCAKELKHKSAISGKMKLCCKCKKQQNDDQFGKLKCSPDGLRYDCKTCRKEYREKNKKQIQEKQKLYYAENKEALLSNSKNYRAENKEIISKQRAEYRKREDVKKHIQQKNKDYLPIKKEKIKNLRKESNDFRISEILRSKFNREIRRKKYSDFLGCDGDFFKKWIEFQFTSNMNWDNLGNMWHIDHVLPISKFDLTKNEEIKICFHWTNMQPLEKIENISKSNKLQLHHYFNNLVSVFRFNKFNTQFIGYQTVNESLQWLRTKTSDMVKMPHMISPKTYFGSTFAKGGMNEMDNPQPSSYRRNDETMEKVQRLNGFGSEEINQSPITGLRDSLLPLNTKYAERRGKIVMCSITK